MVSVDPGDSGYIIEWQYFCHCKLHSYKVWQRLTLCMTVFTGVNHNQALNEQSLAANDDDDFSDTRGRKSKRKCTADGFLIYNEVRDIVTKKPHVSKWYNSRSPPRDRYRMASISMEHTYIVQYFRRFNLRLQIIVYWNITKIRMMVRDYNSHRETIDLSIPTQDPLRTCWFILKLGHILISIRIYSYNSI